MTMIPSMKHLLCKSIVLLQLIINSNHFLFAKDFPSVFPSRLEGPGLNSKFKCWWAKEITPDFHVCGRPSDRQIKYAAEAGFQCIVSLFTYPEDNPPGEFGYDYLPITSAEKVLVEDVAGLQFFSLLEPMDEWSSIEAIEQFTSIVPTLKKPALLHCDRGYTITFVVLLYMANQTRYDSSFEPKIYSKEFYEISASMGLDFLSRIPMEVVSEITGEAIPDKSNPSLPRPVFENDDWLDYWFAHPVHTNLFTAGQITKSHYWPLVEFGYKSVVNIRKGVTHNGKSSQEDVNLLNINEGEGTFGTTPSRQSIEKLRESVIDNNKKVDYIQPDHEFNFETKNEEEFGDHIGYNEELERKFFEKENKLKYYFMPYDSKNDDFRSYMKTNIDALMQISKNGPVLVHCARGYRAALVAVLVAGVQYDLSFEWGLQRLREMGFGITPTSHPDVYQTYSEMLRHAPRVEL